jgi:CheY-like chemotaxis protein
MPICDGYSATRRIRDLEKRAPYNFNGLPYSHQLNGRIPVLAVSASLPEKQREELEEAGFDGWTLKPLNWVGVAKLLRGVTNVGERDMYRPGRWCATIRFGLYA